MSNQNIINDLFVSHEPDNLPSGVDTLIASKIKNWKPSIPYLILNKNYNRYSKINLLNTNYNIHNLKYHTYSELRKIYSNKFISFILSFFNFFFNLFYIYKIYKKYKFSRVFIHSGGWPIIGNCFLNIIISRLLNIKTFLIIHNYPNQKVNNNILFKIQKLIILYFNLNYITVSDSCKNILSSYLNKRISVINNSTDKIEFSYIKKKNKYFKIIYVGEISKRKGLDTLFNSLKKITIKISVEIIGSGEKTYESYIKRMYKNLKHEVKFTKYSNNPKKTIYQSDLLILPSVSYESFGLVLIEAMSCKTAILASKSGGISNVLKNGYDSLLFKPNNPNDLYSCLIKIISNKNLRKRIAYNGYRKFLHNFQTSHMVSKYKALGL